MIGYILRRLRLMAVTLFGVMTLTFLLFNVVGGDQASVVLGEKVSARQLADYDAERGLDKPLFFGRWVSTRALRDADLERGPGPWNLEGWTWEDPGRDPPRLIAHTAVTNNIPLAFGLESGSLYRISITYRAPAAAALRLGEDATPLPPADDWTRRTLRFPGADLEAGDVRLVAPAGMEIRSASLRRRVQNPFDSQFAHYIGQILTLDLGRSHFTGQKVTAMLKEGVGPSLMLSVPILLAGLVISVLFSLVCAYYRDTWIDRAFVVLAVTLMSVNYLVWIVAGQYVLGYWLGWFPVWGFESWTYLLLPVLIGVVSSLGQDLRLYRTIMLDELYREYIRTASAKGCPPARILFRHVLRNALIPVVTNISLVLPYLYTGSLLLETYFGIPGLGYLSINGIFTSDFDVVRAVVLIGSVLYMLSNLLADILYGWLDPRVTVS